MKRVAIVVATVLGFSVGLFWLLAVDAGVNGASWPPNWRSGPARVTCPFMPFIGIGQFWNALVPLLNAGSYGLLVLALLRLRRLWYSRFRARDRL